jgi:hypothetical protein
MIKIPAGHLPAVNPAAQKHSWILLHCKAKAKSDNQCKQAIKSLLYYIET